MMELGIGELGLDPDVFWSLTFAEFQLRIQAHRIRIEREWEQTRWLGAIMINLQVKRAKQVTPEKLVPLSFDVERKKQNRISKDEIEFMMKNWK